MVQLVIEKLSRFDRIAEPCTVAIPLAQGVLTDVSRLAVHDGERTVPSQAQVTATWPDASVKWLVVDFLADLPGNQGKTFTVDWISNQAAASGPLVTVRETGAGLVIDSGVMQVELNPPGSCGILGRISGAGFQFCPGSFTGPTIYDETGNSWVAVIDTAGWQIIKAGPVVVTVEAHGVHRNNVSDTLLDFEIRLTAFAGKPWLQMDYRIINREKQSEVVLTGMEFSFNPGSRTEGNLRTALAISNYQSIIRTGNGATPLCQIIDADYLLNDQNEHIPETFYGTFWADWNREGQGGVCLAQYQAYQNFPKSLEVDGQGLTAGILPRGSRLRLLQGVAKTHRFMLHFHPWETDLETINIRSLQFELPDRPVVKPVVYQEAGVFENIFCQRKLAWVERALINMADSRVKAYGILAWGDAPDFGYTEQGRGGGLMVWTNNEYDFPHAAMLLYAKTAERRFLDYMLVSARHLMDVDVCHFSDDPLRFQGQVTHSAHHVTGKVSPCHEWVEGLLDFYHITGDRRALETAMGIGNNIVRLLAQPRYQGEGGINARETGWALRSLVALYRETHDPVWLDPADKIVGHFESWKKAYGGWLSPYTDHCAIRVPFMIAVAVNSLMCYYRVRPQERIKQMVVEAVRDLVDNCLLDNGLFFYKELPSLRRNGNNLLVLEALAHAYEFTGNKAYLEAGLPTFELVARLRQNLGQAKREMEDAVVVMGGDGPKRFAQSFLAVAYYYRVAVEAGVLV